MTDTTTTTTTTQTKAPAKPALGTPEHDQAMLDRFSRGTAPEGSDQPVKPENVPDKFWNAQKGGVDLDALLQSYGELERKMSAPKDPPKPDASTEAKADDKKEEGTGDKSAEQEVAEAAGLDWTALETQVQTTGKLDDASIEAITKLGIPKEIVEAHVEAVKMAQEFAVMRTANYVGGQQNLDFLMSEAATKLTPAEIEEYDRQLASPNWKMALDSLKAKFLPNADDAFGGKTDPFANVSGNPGGGVVPFADPAELSRAINERTPDGKRRYDVDPRYREQVAARLRITKRN